MSLHLGFSDSDDESGNTVKYECSDPNHCDKGESCDGEHGYSLEYLRLKFAPTKTEESAMAKSDVTVDQNPRSPLHESESAIEVPLDEYEAPPSPLSSDPVEVAPVVAPDPSSDDLDLDAEADSQDACSRS